MMTKQELRLKYKALRADITPELLDELSIKIANRLLSLPIWDHTYYHTFLPIIRQKEVNTEYVLNILAGKDKEIVISKSNFNAHSMIHYLLTDNTLIKSNSFGIPEPVDGIEVPEEKIDVVFVPLLAFDQKGHRVGYGKGFYDRFLSKCKENTLKIGLSLFEAEDEIADPHETDIKLDFCVTPKTTFSFK